MLIDCVILNPHRQVANLPFWARRQVRHASDRTSAPRSHNCSPIGHASVTGPQQHRRGSAPRSGYRRCPRTGPLCGTPPRSLIDRRRTTARSPIAVRQHRAASSASSLVSLTGPRQQRALGAYPCRPTARARSYLAADQDCPRTGGSIPIGDRRPSISRKELF
jgi:hypothetical protein